jgi:hypothetical protein
MQMKSSKGVSDLVRKRKRRASTSAAIEDCITAATKDGETEKKSEITRVKEPRRPLLTKPAS